MPSIPYTFNASSIARSSEVNSNFTTLANAILPTFVFSYAGGLVTGTNLTIALIAHYSLTISKAYAYVKTAPTGANLIIDINKNGTSIWNVTQGNRLTITAGSQSGNQTSFDTTSLAEGDILTIDIDQIGSTIAGTDLTVELKTT